jgi:signal transduction histidine kinase
METAKVLLIEDNPGDARLVCEALAAEEPRRFDVVHEGRLADGCERAAREPFVAVLLDLSLPDSGGLQTVRRARAAFDFLPIVVLTGLEDESVAVAALAEGAQDYLVKSDLDLRALPRALCYAIERHRLESRLREVDRLEAVGHLAGGIAHQFNNVMTSVLGYADLLLAQCDAHDSRQGALEEIARGARQAAELMRQLQAVGRRQRLAPQRLDLNWAIRNMAEMLRDIAGPRVEVDLRLGAVSPVVFDAANLEYVVAAVTIYARDAMPEGGRVVIETAMAPLAPHPGGPYVLLTVSDTSAGVDAVTRSRLFEPSQNLQELVARQRSGLELPSVFGLMAQSSGHIVLAVADTGGNCFQLYFPTSESAALRVSHS